MDKKEFSASLLIIGLSVLFAIAATALFFSKGKSKFWTAKKMKLGAMILTLTVTTQSCSWFRTCYDPVDPENTMYLELNDTINLNDSTRILNGEIYNVTSKEFSYKLLNNTVDTLTYSENIIADDGVFDNYSEDFTIELTTTIEPGEYIFQLFDVGKEKQDNVQNINREYFVYIKKE